MLKKPNVAPKEPPKLKSIKPKNTISTEEKEHKNIGANIFQFDKSKISEKTSESRKVVGDDQEKFIQKSEEQKGRKSTFFNRLAAIITNTTQEVSQAINPTTKQSISPTPQEEAETISPAPEETETKLITLEADISTHSSLQIEVKISQVNTNQQKEKEESLQKEEMHPLPEEIPQESKVITAIDY
jgi:hypothetical protein